MSLVSLTGDLKGLNRAHARFLANAGSAKEEGVKRSAVILARAWRKRLSVPGHGVASAPGEAPKKQRGVLAKAVAQGIVGSGRIVAQLRFTALMLEEGVNSTGKHKLVIQPRPAASRALEDAREEMVQATAELMAGVRP